MAIEIEVLGGNKKQLSVAFYFAVPVDDQSPAANDQGRVAAGTHLSAGELQDLKDGKIIELVWLVSVAGFTVVQAKARLIAFRSDAEAGALADYVDQYRFAGISYDGTTWS